MDDVTINSSTPRTIIRLSLLVVIAAGSFGWLPFSVIPPRPALPENVATASAWIGDWLTSIAVRSAQCAAAMLTLGLLVAICINRRIHGFPGYYARVILLQLTAIGLMFSGPLAALLPTRVWLQFVVAVITASSLAGLAVGGELQLGWRGLGRLCGLSAAVLGIAAAWGITSWNQAVSSRPVEIVVELPSIARRDQLVEQIQSAISQNSNTGPVVEVELSGEQIDTLLMWAMAVEELPVPATVEVREAELVAQVSQPIAGLNDRWLNVTAAGTGRVFNGVLFLEIIKCQVGELHLPATLLGALSEMLSVQLNQSGQVRRTLSPIMSLTWNADRAMLVGHREGLRRQLRQVVHRRSQPIPQQSGVVRLYVEQIFEHTRELPAGEPRLRGAIREAFRVAAVRSSSGDPVAENRAALLALAYVVGEPRIEPLIGQLRDVVDHDQIRQRIGEVPLRGRRDWAKHYILSAALTGLSNPFIASIIGEWKERMDAHDGGSGFSFADLMADEAGTALARCCLKNATWARAMQIRLSRLESTDELLPDPSHLPEGITADEFDSEYGSGRSEAFRKLNRWIAAQLQQLAVLRPPE